MLIGFAAETSRRNKIFNIILQTAWILILSEVHYVSSYLQRLLPRLGPTPLPLLQHHLHPPTDSNSRQSNIIKRTVQLIRDARHFFDQGTGCRPPPSLSEGEIAAPAIGAERGIDKTAREVWNMVRNDVLYRSHTHASYRGSILLYLFLPSSSSDEFYLEVLPLWMDSWQYWSLPRIRLRDDVPFGGMQMTSHSMMSYYVILKIGRLCK